MPGEFNYVSPLWRPHVPVYVFRTRDTAGPSISETVVIIVMKEKKVPPDAFPDRDPSPCRQAGRFESIGVKLPETRLTTKEIMAGVKMWGKIDLEGLTGIVERRICSAGEDSYTLSIAAARDCLRYSRYRAEDLEMIICCSITRYREGLNFVYEPPVSLTVKEAIGASQAMNFDITNACAGMLTGVYIMNDFIRRGVIKCGMVISGEYLSSAVRNAVPKVKTVFSGQLASLTVGDCGAAVIMERAPAGGGGLHVSNFLTLAKYSDLCIGEPCAYAPGAQMVTAARKIHQVAIADSPPILKRALAEAGVEYGDIDHFIPHQTSIRAIYSGGKHLARYLGSNVKNIVTNFQEYGNTASTTHFLAMYRYLREGRFKKGDKILIMAFASGLVIGVVIFTMDDLVDRYGSAD